MDGRDPACLDHDPEDRGFLVRIVEADEIAAGFQIHRRRFRFPGSDEVPEVADLLSAIRIGCPSVESNMYSCIYRFTRP
jgi:hypothetical protein